MFVQIKGEAYKKVQIIGDFSDQILIRKTIVGTLQQDSYPWR